jgi:hypothetical protein
LETKTVERFVSDLEALNSFFSSDKPPRRLVRGRYIFIVRYGFGDASGGGFGATWESSEGIKYRFGIWGTDNTDKSSNYRELCNLVESLEEVGRDGQLVGVEIFLMTDNSTAERAYYKGTSSSKLLHELVHRLRRLELEEGCIIHLIHVAGTRMIEQGTDGLSRGNLGEGVMKGAPITSFIPLHLTALERKKDDLFEWISNWAQLENDPLGGVELLSPSDWFGRGHDHVPGGTLNSDGRWWPDFKPGIFLWNVAPAAAEIALEELRKARLKRHDSVHIFLCPRLMEMTWRKHLNKSADLVFEIPARYSYWSKDMHEPLILALYFPYLSHRPWHLQGSPAIVGMGKRLQKMWKEGDESTGTLLRQFWCTARNLQYMPSRLVFPMLRSTNKLEVSCSGCNYRCWSGLEEKER